MYNGHRTMTAIALDGTIPITERIELHVAAMAPRMLELAGAA